MDRLGDNSICGSHHGEQPPLLQRQGDQPTQERSLRHHPSISTILLRTHPEPATRCIVLSVPTLCLVGLCCMGMANGEKKEEYQGSDCLMVLVAQTVKTVYI